MAVEHVCFSLRFLRSPVWLELSTSARALYTSLIVGVCERMGEATVPSRGLAEGAGLDPKTVKRAVEELLASGLLRPGRSPGESAYVVYSDVVTLECAHQELVSDAQRELSQPPRESSQMTREESQVDGNFPKKDGNFPNLDGKNPTFPDPGQAVVTEKSPQQDPSDGAESVGDLLAQISRMHPPMQAMRAELAQARPVFPDNREFFPDHLVELLTQLFVNSWLSEPTPLNCRRMGDPGKTSNDEILQISLDLKPFVREFCGKFPPTLSVGLKRMAGWRKLEELIQKAKASPLLSGQNHQKRAASLEWLSRGDSTGPCGIARRILAGAFDGTEKAHAEGSQV